MGCLVGRKMGKKERNIHLGLPLPFFFSRMAIVIKYVASGEIFDESMSKW